MSKKVVESWEDIKGLNLILMFGGLVNGSTLLLDDIKNNILIKHPVLGTYECSYDKYQGIFTERLQLLRVFKFKKTFERH